MLALISQLAPLLEQIKQYDMEISRLFLSQLDSPIFASLPRAGKRLAPRLLAGWGDDRGRYASAASVQALAGTSPVAYQSGHYAKAHRRYVCIKPFRNVLYQFAWQSTFQEPWATAWQCAAKALARFGEPAIAPLIAALADDNSYVRAWSADALGHVGDPRAVAPLRR